MLLSFFSIDFKIAAISILFTIKSIIQQCGKMETKGFFQLEVINLKSSQMSWLALSALFEYICYGSTAILNILILSVRGPSSASDSDV